MATLQSAVRGQEWMASMPITRITNCGHYLKRDTRDSTLSSIRLRSVGLGYEGNAASPLMRLHCDAMSYS